MATNTATTLVKAITGVTSTTVVMVTGVVLETPVAMVPMVHTVKIAAAFKVDVVINVEDTTTTTGADGGAMLVVVGIESGSREDMPKHTGVSFCDTFSFEVQDSTVLDTCEVILGQKQIV